MKRQSLSVVIFLGMAAGSVFSQTQPVNSSQLMAWLASGISNARLVRIVKERGLAAAPVKRKLHELESAGADAALLHTLSATKSANSATEAEFSASLVRAVADARAQRFHEAELDLHQALTADPQNAAFHFALGTMLRQQERWDDAFDEISLSAQLMPDFPENHSALAYIFYRLDDGPNSIAEARTALSMDPQNSEAYQFLGLGLYSNGQYAASAHAFLESLARDPDNPETYYDLGITLHADGNSIGAMKAYRQAVHLKPGFWQAYSNLAMILHEQGQFEDAIAVYKQAKQLAPDQASVRNNLGNTYCDKGDFDAAAVELKELYQQHPEWQQGHTCLARAYMAKKNYPDAIGELQLAVQQNEAGAAEHRALGEALLLDDKLNEAVHELRIAVTLNPDSDAAHHILGTALFRQEQNKEAETEFREAVRLNPSPDNHYALAACLMSMDRYNDALAELEIAAKLDPERPLYRARRDELLKLMNQITPR